MFYQILDSEHNIIAAAENPMFYKHLNHSNAIIPASADIADSVRVNGMLYTLQRFNTSEVRLYTIHEIDEQTYWVTSAQLNNNTPKITIQLKNARNSKIQELSQCCNKAIIEGCDVLIEDTYEHFDFTNEDQLNINRLVIDINLNSSNSVIYHSSKNKVKRYSALDFLRIYNQMNKHINYHTTYFNLLKNCINNMYNIAEITAITYGYQLPDLADRELLETLRR